MTMTEALHYYSSRTRPSENWMRQHYSHFWPSAKDEALRVAIHQPRKKKKMKDIFDEGEEQC